MPQTAHLTPVPVRPSFRLAIGIAAIPISVVLAVYAYTYPFVLTGDEPHYLILADSIARDFDVDLRNNYESDAQTKEIYGPIPPHIRRHRWGWMPYHTPGLSALLAAPFALAGVQGARLTLTLLAGLLPCALFLWFSRSLSRRHAAWLTVGLTVSFPFSFGAAQIYPDLVAGVAVMVLLVWLLARSDDRPGHAAPWFAWAAFWLISGLLPWLNVKYAVTTVLLGLAGASVAWRSTVTRVSRAGLVTVALLAVGPLLMVEFNRWAYHSIWGGRGGDELTRSGLRALMMFLGLHLDQGQGMFVQQPLLLLGVAGLPVMWRARPKLAVWWLLLYASLIVPNSFQLARWGGYSPDGRFGWSAAWLWAFPLAYLASAVYDRCGRYLVAVVSVALAYQVALASRWLRDPFLVFPMLAEDLNARDSFFPVGIRHLLPSYYLWDFKSYLTYPPNVLAMLLVIALIVAGTVAAVVYHRPSHADAAV